MYQVTDHLVNKFVSEDSVPMFCLAGFRQEDPTVLDGGVSRENWHSTLTFQLKRIDLI